MKKITIFGTNIFFSLSLSHVSNCYPSDLSTLAYINKNRTSDLGALLVLRLEYPAVFRVILVTAGWNSERVLPRVIGPSAPQNTPGGRSFKISMSNRPIAMPSTRVSSRVVPQYKTQRLLAFLHLSHFFLSFSHSFFIFFASFGRIGFLVADFARKIHT